ncbi:MAG: DUF1460 domain-containing protein [Prolixibacteraceae bacterium]|nr:DUF1460 domain-containing protein [Prolixibacteraceae bacterium]
MKLAFFSVIVALLLLGCSSFSKNKTEDPGENIIYQSKDKEILAKVIAELNTEKDLSIADLMIKAGLFFLETPYVERTLEKEPEQLVVNLRGMDCNTFAENCLAIARTIKSNNPGFEQFAKELKNIRYRDGVLDNYPSRLHYFSDWIYNNDQKKLVENVSQNITNIPYPLEINFMSTHPDSYLQLKNNEDFISTISVQEKEISNRLMHYIPENKIAEIENLLQDGDIAGITTNVSGLDIQHVVILIRHNGRIRLLHASSSANKVVLSEESLEDYLKNSKSATGIMVARPL